MDATPDTEACGGSLDGSVAVRVPLMKCVQKTQAVTKAMDEKNWELAVKLRGKIFESHLHTYKLLTRFKPPETVMNNGWNLAVMHVGAPACGMNAAVRSFTKNCYYGGHTPIAI